MLWQILRNKATFALIGGLCWGEMTVIHVICKIILNCFLTTNVIKAQGKTLQGIFAQPYQAMKEIVLVSF